MQKTIIATTLLLVIGFMAATGQALADTSAEQSQSQKQEGSAECETEIVNGAYGQTFSRCRVQLTQEQKESQKIVYVEKEKEVEKEVLVHKPVDTALDTKSVTTAVGTIVSGAGAFVLKLKKKISK